MGAYRRTLVELSPPVAVHCVAMELQPITVQPSQMTGLRIAGALFARILHAIAGSGNQQMSYSNASAVTDQVLKQQLSTADTGHERHCNPAVRPQAQQISSNSKAADLRRSAAVAGLRRCSERNGY